ncbi:phage tail protein [Paenibacillus humicola]|uniref:phage tail protein n=1 Tax=Paenibacillus humicola TaxID=3110540 RepID=UPI00237C148E|nr:tail fiber protein [Paenibacillus humicola]
MSEPFIGEIRQFGFGFAPKGWHICDGSILPISNNQALFSILGTTYGGNGTTTFALPDLRGRVPVKFSSSIALGEMSGEENHTLTVQEMPVHTHGAMADSAAPSSREATGNAWTNTGTIMMYQSAANTTMNGAALSASGGGQPHPNMQPYNVVNYCIALQGIYPSRN